MDRSKYETVKLLEGNIYSTIHETDVGKDFLNRTHFAKELRPTIDTQLFIKLKSFRAGNKTIN